VFALAAKLKKFPEEIRQMPWEDVVGMVEFMRMTAPEMPQEVKRKQNTNRFRLRK
jgi:hypothetical protein